jgi:GDPmannose 4,6-dehydratase
VIATGETHTVREFVEKAFAEVSITMAWEGEGVSEIGRNTENCQALVKVDSRYFRPTEVDFLLGDPTKAKENLGWKPKLSFENLIKLMVKKDLEEAERDHLVQREGFTVYNHFE